MLQKLTGLRSDSTSLSCLDQAHEVSSVSSLEYRGCEVLERLGLSWCPLIRALIYRRLEIPFFYKDLKSLLHTEVKSATVEGSMLGHIVQSFGICPEDSLKTLFEAHLKNLTLSHPIPGLPAPEQRFRCPYCHKWESNQNSHRHEVKDDSLHVKALKAEVDKVYTILLTKERRMRGIYRLPLRRDWKPTTDSIRTPPTTPLVNHTDNDLCDTVPHYISLTGWVEYMQGLNLRDPLALVKLVIPPSPATMKRFKPGTDGYKIEIFLCAIRQVLIAYFHDAESKIRSLSPAMQDLPTWKYV